MDYDYLIVGAGPFGCTFARCLTDAGRRCLVIDRRPHVGGNAYTRREEDIDVHVYGAHIFHTDDQGVWRFVNRFSSFNSYRHIVRCRVGRRVYSFPLNLLTLNQVMGITTPAEAQQWYAARQIEGCIDAVDDLSCSLEDYCRQAIGDELYELLIAGYTRKQWDMEPSQIPARVIARLPIRFTYDDAYFSDRYQGIPDEGYACLFSAMLEGVEVKLGVEYLSHRAELNDTARRVLYTGPIDRLWANDQGALPYRSLRFEHEWHEGDYQGIAVMNYPEPGVPWTRIIEHKHFCPRQQKRTLVTKEIPKTRSGEQDECFYPVETGVSRRLADEYCSRAKAANYLIGGRLGTYRYLDLDDTIAEAMQLAEAELCGKQALLSGVSEHLNNR